MCCFRVGCDPALGFYTFCQKTALDLFLLFKNVDHLVFCCPLSPLNSCLHTPTVFQSAVCKVDFIFLYSLSVTGLLTLFFTLFPFSLDFLMHTHHSSSASLSEICTGCTARAAVRDGIPVPEGGGGTHLRVWGRYNGRRCSQDCPANHQAAGQHEPGGCWLLYQQASGKKKYFLAKRICLKRAPKTKFANLHNFNPPCWQLHLLCPWRLTLHRRK